MFGLTTCFIYYKDPYLSRKLRYIIYSLCTLILSAYPEVAGGRGGSDGSCCPCPHEPYSQTTKKPSYKIFYKNHKRAIPPWLKTPPPLPPCSGNCCLCPPGPNSTPEPYSQTTTTQFPIKTKTPIYNFLKRGRRAIPPWLLHDIS